jgi:DNA adenine methylase
VSDIRPVAPKPFLKWVGGKGRLLRQYAPYFPSEIDKYHEPFLGGAAVFFYLYPKTAVLSDLNPELINTYRVVRDNCQQLIECLGRFRVNKEEFYRIRAMEPHTLNNIQRAARTIYLNRTCYNGLYRVNKAGRFNVPYGQYKAPTVLNETLLRAASDALRCAQLEIEDFSGVLKRAAAGDFVYLDPPYQPLNRTSNFTNYTPWAFRAEEQERLAQIYRDLDRIGCRLMLSNSNTSFVQELYKGFRQEIVWAKRSINCKGNLRGGIQELLILNYEINN